MEQRFVPPYAAISYAYSTPIFQPVVFCYAPPNSTSSQIPADNISKQSSDSDLNSMKIRTKTQTWNQFEDSRLKVAVETMGTEDWNAIAAYVGNGRTKNQCSQRWNRCLNPTISKSKWSPQEDEKLINLVDIYGTKAWKKIALILGNRSDVQCRYHYKMMTCSDFRSNVMNQNTDIQKKISQKCDEKVKLPSIEDLFH